MITSIKAYYDGKNFIPQEKHNFKINQQVLIVVDEGENNSNGYIEAFLGLKWFGNETPDDIISTISNARSKSPRFEETNELFD